LECQYVDKPRTGLRPPGGLVLAQLQLGSLHLVASQEYPAAAELDVAPLMDPSCASTSRGAKTARRSARANIALRFFVLSKAEAGGREVVWLNLGPALDDFIFSP
jgi:hypothetical protein